MSTDILQFPIPKPNDGGKARIIARRRKILGPSVNVDDLAIGHADNGMPSDSAYCAPASDPA